MAQLPPPIPPQGMPPGFPPQGMQPIYQAQNPGGGAAVASLVLGILSIFLPWVGVVLAIIGLVLAIVAKNKRTLSRGMATAGMILSIIGLVLQGLSLSMMIPVMSKAPKFARSAACEMNLSGLGKAIVLYRNKNGDRCPASLQVLLKDGIVTAKTLQCPEDQITSGSSYFYCPPQDGGKQGNAIIACDAAPRHITNSNPFWFSSTNDAVNVLRADGSVALLNSSEFQQELQKPYNARFAAEYAKAASLSPQQRVTYSPPGVSNAPAESEPDDSTADEPE